MKLNVLMICTAIYLALVGVGYMLAPDALLNGALGPGAQANVVAALREYGGSLIGIAIVNWLARNAEASPARNAILLANIVGFALATIADVIGQLSGAPAVGWVFTVINALFALAFLVAQLSNMSKKAGLVQSA